MTSQTDERYLQVATSDVTNRSRTINLDLDRPDGMLSSARLRYLILKMDLTLGQEVTGFASVNKVEPLHRGVLNFELAARDRETLVSLPGETIPLVSGAGQAAVEQAIPGLRKASPVPTVEEQSDGFVQSNYNAGDVISRTYVLPCCLPVKRSVVTIELADPSTAYNSEDVTGSSYRMDVTIGSAWESYSTAIPYVLKARSVDENIIADLTELNRIAVFTDNPMSDTTHYTGISENGKKIDTNVTKEYYRASSNYLDGILPMVSTTSGPAVNTSTVKGGLGLLLGTSTITNMYAYLRNYSQATNVYIDAKSDQKTIILESSRISRASAESLAA